jgi:hypothetical protein
MTVNLSECEENRKLLEGVVDAWEHYRRLMGVLPTEDERVSRETAQRRKEAVQKASQLSTELNEHAKTCSFCKPIHSQ